MRLSRLLVSLISVVDDDHPRMTTFVTSEGALVFVYTLIIDWIQLRPDSTPDPNQGLLGTRGIMIFE